MLFNKEVLENWDLSIAELKRGIVKSSNPNASSKNREIWMKIYAIGLYVMTKEKVKEAIFYGWNKRLIYLNLLAKGKNIIREGKHIDIFTDFSGYAYLDQCSKKEIFETVLFHLKYTAGYEIDNTQLDMRREDFNIIPVIINK